MSVNPYQFEPIRKKTSEKVHSDSSESEWEDVSGDNSELNHSFVSPRNSNKARPNITLPSGVNVTYVKNARFKRMLVLS